MEKSYQWYKPMEIAKLSLIKNSRGDKATVSGNYNFILELIKSGKLRAKNYSVGTQRQNWIVREDEIERYNAKVN